MDVMSTILGVIGALAAAATPILWGSYFWKYRHQFRSKQNQRTKPTPNKR